MVSPSVEAITPPALRAFIEPQPYIGSGPGSPPSVAVWINSALISADVALRAFVFEKNSWSRLQSPEAVGLAIEVPDIIVYAPSPSLDVEIKRNPFATTSGFTRLSSAGPKLEKSVT